jgi:uncharacterized protein YodC (DUF2158 family)
MSEFMAGDLVRLKSDGDRAYPMTVEAVVNGVPQLVWRDLSGAMHRITVMPDALKLHVEAE